MIQRLVKILLSPYVIALLLSLVIILFLPPIFNRYKIEPEGTGISSYKNPESYLYFKDLNNDGLGEKIDTYYEGAMRPSIQIFMPNGGIYDQWNLRGSYTHERYQSVAFGDINNDSDQEIIILTIVDDSIFFSCIDELDGSFGFRDKFLVTISRKYSPELSYGLRCEGFHDLDGDGYNELLVNAGGARSLQPRMLFAYDFARSRLISCETFGVTLSPLHITDLTGDGIPEITGNTSASGNIHDSLGIPYSDYSAWLMVLDNKLDLLFEPLEFPGFRNELSVIPHRSGNKSFITALLNPLGPDIPEPVLYLIDAQGKVLDERKIPGMTKVSRSFFSNPFDQNGTTFLINDMNGIIELDQDLQVISQLDHPLPANYITWTHDLENDGKPELIAKEENGDRLMIYRSLKSRPLIYQIPAALGATDISFGIRKKDSPVIVLQGKDKYLLLSYSSNPLFYFRLVIYAGVYTGLLLFILLIMKIQRIQTEKKQAVKDQILQLQLKTIHNQMDPHFTFNVFNSIAHIIKSEERDYAFNSFLKFSGIIRSTLLDSDKIVRTLEDEVKFVENYLALEKLRYKDRIEHEITISPEVKMDTDVPKMILQIFVENSVKHGLRHKPEGGKLTITIREEDKILVMTIEDNGVGREKARQLSKDSTGMGLGIMNRYIDLFNQFDRQKIRYEIEDLYLDDGGAAGTRVKVVIG